MAPSVAGLVLAAASAAWVPEGLPPAPESGPILCRGGYLTPEQGAAALAEAVRRFPDRASWEPYAAHVRTRIREGAQLAPWPRRTPLGAVFRHRRTHDGYTVENVAFESIPGYYVTGNLFRPTTPPPHAVVLATHGHSRPVARPEDYDTHARFSPAMQARCATLARMGAIVLSVDMFGYGDSMQLVGEKAHRQPVALTLQLWNAMRALDLLLSLDGADPARVAVSGESGGATQALLLTALDPRVGVSVPVVMVSGHFFGGCTCESGRPIHRGPDHFASNAMIAALAAPRPQLVVSDGKDWTSRVPDVEHPFLRRIYGYFDAEDAVRNVHLADEGHDYGPSKRAALYRFLAETLRLDLAAARAADGSIDETRVSVEPSSRLRVFDADFPIPPHALHEAAAIEQVLRDLQAEAAD